MRLFSKMVGLFLLALLLIPVAAEAGYRAVVIDGHSGDVLINQDGYKRQAPASLTKMMTALVAADRGGDIVTVGNYRPRLDEQQLGLKRGEKMTRNDLLRAALINSNNDAAVALADSGGNRKLFLEQMNIKARNLGLSNSHFKHPAGMDTPGQYTTAFDMVRLGQALMLNSHLAEIVGRNDAWLLSGREKRYIKTTNQLLGGSIDGIKTGYTNKAGFSIVTSDHRGSRWVVAAVLGASSSEERFAAAELLMNRGLGKMKRRSLGRRGQLVATVPVTYNHPAQFKLARTVSVWTSRRGPIEERFIGLPRELSGPMAAGSRVGKVEYYIDGDKKGQSHLILASSLQKPSFMEKLLTDLPLLPLAIFLLLAATAYFFIERPIAASGKSHN